uniref:Uncharacterized protein n=1 Tax=Anolis carolinensis TaxID=28377 RepID=A0A803U0S8_ANOCA
MYLSFIYHISGYPSIFICIYICVCIQVMLSINETVGTGLQIWGCFATSLAASLDKLSKKKRPIPKIIVTGPSEELLVTSYSDMLPETKTIRDTEDYGAYTVHSRPSTVDAYRDREREHEH